MESWARELSLSIVNWNIYIPVWPLSLNVGFWAGLCDWSAGLTQWSSNCRGQIIRPQIPRCVTCLLMADEIMTKVPNLARLVLADDYSLCWNVVSSNSILLLWRAVFISTFEHKMRYLLCTTIPKYILLQIMLNLVVKEISPVSCSYSKGNQW